MPCLAFPALALLILATLAGCAAPSQRAGSDTNPHTGVTSHRSDLVEIERRPATRLLVRAVALGAAGHTQYHLLTFVRRDDPNMPRIRSVWSRGVRLPYMRGDSRKVDCAFVPGCLREEAGSIRLSRNVFESAARGAGLEFQMIGSRGTYQGLAPARIFAEVLERMAGPG
jgi:hypothetical protein